MIPSILQCLSSTALLFLNLFCLVFCLVYILFCLVFSDFGENHLESAGNAGPRQASTLWKVQCSWSSWRQEMCISTSPGQLWCTPRWFWHREPTAKCWGSLWILEEYDMWLPGAKYSHTDLQVLLSDYLASTTQHCKQVFPSPLENHMNHMCMNNGRDTTTLS